MTDQTNPLLASLKLPGRTFQLPSRGVFYNNGELSARDGEIHVRPMSALDEINMKNPDQLFSGTAVDMVFRQCISGIEKPPELLSKDVDAIMMFLRVVTYGPSYEFTAKHTCMDANEHSYIADVDQLIMQMDMIDPTTIEANYTVVLPNGQTVKLQPNRYQQVLELIRANENKKEVTAEDQQRNLTMMLLGVIASVEGISDRAMVKEWITQLPTTYVNRIAEKIDKINGWGPSMTWKCTCKDCSAEFDVEIPINPVSFFTE